MVAIVTSKNGLPIRLPDERWAHIMEEHSELAGMKDQMLNAIAEPELIVEGGDGELLAVKESEPGKFLVVVYRELDADGFIITAFLTRRAKSLERRKQLWP